MTTPKKVLVTGATGHVGSSTYMVLAAQPEKYDVYALDRQREFSPRVPARNQGLTIPDDKFHLCDLADAWAIRQAVEGMDVVLHLGADPGDDGSWESLLNNNVVGTYNVFEACREAGVPRLIAASSIMVSQGQREQEPYKSIVDKRFDDVPKDYPMLTPESPRSLGEFMAQPKYGQSRWRGFTPIPTACPASVSASGRWNGTDRGHPMATTSL